MQRHSDSRENGEESQSYRKQIPGIVVHGVIRDDKEAIYKNHETGTSGESANDLSTTNVNLAFDINKLYVYVFSSYNLCKRKGLHVNNISVTKPNLSRLMTKPTKWHARPAKTLISLRFAVAWVLSYPLSAKRRLCLSLCWAHMPLCWFCHEAAHLVSQRCLSLLNFFSVARPRKFGNNMFVEQSCQAACTPLRAHDS